MVAVEKVRAANASFFQQRSLVAVFIGATSGIGEYSVREMARLYGGAKQLSLRLYIVGRNSTAAGKIINDCSRACPNGLFTFVQSEDLASINDVDRTSAKILELEQKNAQNDTPRIDFLVMTQGRVVFGPRQGRY
jgi:NAD(P)-dependent dehydrogenase (short-subunit alcohol dehydrogenase family)